MASRKPNKCLICGDDEAPFGFRMPGPVSELPAEWRDKYAYACKNHRDEVEERRNAKARELNLI